MKTPEPVPRTQPYSNFLPPAGADGSEDAVPGAHRPLLRSAR